MSDFTEQQETVIESYIATFRTMTEYIAIEEAYWAQRDETRALAVELEDHSPSALQPLMVEALDRGEFPEDHPVRRNLEAAVEIAEALVEFEAELVAASMDSNPIAGPVI